MNERGRTGRLSGLALTRDADAPVAAATGFWRLTRPPGARRTWLIGPDGHAVFLLGVNTVMRDSQHNGKARCVGIGDYIRRRDPTTAANIEWARLSDGNSGRYSVPRPYGFNSVGAFSETNDFDKSGGDSFMIRAPEDGGAGAPYGVVLAVSPGGADRALKDEDGVVLRSGFSRVRIGDPFNPAFLSDLDRRVADEVVPRRDDPRLQMWFAGNEIGIFDVAQKSGGVRDFRRWLWSDVPPGSSIDAPRCARHALAAFLRSLYRGSIDELNAAWDTTHPSFAAIVDGAARPVPNVHDCNKRCGADLQRFVHDRLLREWVRAVSTRIRAADPNHLIATPRLAIADRNLYRFWTGSPAAAADSFADKPHARVGRDSGDVRYSPLDLLGRDGDAGFDLVAVNAYTGSSTFARPWFTDGLHRLQQQSGLPTLISEFGIRARIAGWSNKGGAGAFVPSGDAVDDQLQRGQRYSSQLGQFIAFRNVVGACWHAWSDRFNPAPLERGDEPVQINLGLVKCADRTHAMTAGDRWDELDEQIAGTNRTIMQRIAEATGF